MFFIPINIGGKSTIPLDHIVTGMKNALPTIAPIYAIAAIIMGSIKPFVKKTWSSDKVNMVFSSMTIIIPFPGSKGQGI